MSETAAQICLLMKENHHHLSIVFSAQHALNSFQFIQLHNMQMLTLISGLVT